MFFSPLFFKEKRKITSGLEFSFRNSLAQERFHRQWVLVSLWICDEAVDFVARGWSRLLRVSPVSVISSSPSSIFRRAPEGQFTSEADLESTSSLRCSSSSFLHQRRQLYDGALVSGFLCSASVTPVVVVAAWLLLFGAQRHQVSRRSWEIYSRLGATLGLRLFGLGVPMDTTRHFLFLAAVAGAQLSSRILFGLLELWERSYLGAFLATSSAVPRTPAYKETRLNPPFPGLTTMVENGY
ncbi:hypothetical protein DY000_02042358 [Brassica cretica]|uniref:Transmembrane protein n=1 Tax=Brassica cretica TaxID=69181 RepID=A0ABQ7BIV5_BRACR|nr:hypothetical protein DY000_02042358 [Brassica cretica]